MKLDEFRIREVSIKSIDDRVRRLASKIIEGKQDPYVRTIATRILNRFGVPERQWRQEAQAIFDFVVNDIRYTLDTYDVDLFQRARRTLQLEAGDCDDKSILMGALLQSVGYPVKIKIVDTKGTPSGWNHIYLLVGLPPNSPKQWIPLDAGAATKKFGWEVEKSRVRKSRIFTFRPK